MAPGALPRVARGRNRDALRSPEVLRSQLLWLRTLANEIDLMVPEPTPTSAGSLVGEVIVEAQAVSGLRASLRRLRRWREGFSVPTYKRYSLSQAPEVRRSRESTRRAFKAMSSSSRHSRAVNSISLPPLLTFIVCRFISRSPTRRMSSPSARLSTALK